MKRSILGRTAFSAAVALALGFGVREAVASPAAQAARPYCEDQLDCENFCAARYPGQTVGAVCTAGHSCFCYP